MKKKTAARRVPAKAARIKKKQKRHDKDKNPTIVAVECSDNLSLFRAIRIGMLYYEKEGGKWEPAEHYAWSDRLKRDAEDLWIEVGKTRKDSTYGLDDVRKVYEYLQKTFPGTYRILVFSESSGTHTVYNSGNNAKHTICLYYRNGHFDLIKTPQKFFRTKHYCVDCEKTYEDLKAHTECKIRCRQCLRNGYGYPCKGDMDLECTDCHKLFVNKDCMDATQALLVQHLAPMYLLQRAVPRTSGTAEQRTYMRQECPTYSVHRNRAACRTQGTGARRSQLRKGGQHTAGRKSTTKYPVMACETELM